MRLEVEWLNDALAEKAINLVMTHYMVRDGFMTATNGEITASHPINIEGEFIVPGAELEQILKRLSSEPTIKLTDEGVVLRAGRFSGTLKTLPNEEWRFPDPPEPFLWEKFPPELLNIVRDLRPFIVENLNALHRFSMGVAIDHGWCYATNGAILAGALFPRGTNQKFIIPYRVLDFISSRILPGDAMEWAVTDHHLGFRWPNGAWMRSTTLVTEFPARAGEMIRSIPARCSQPITEDYRRAAIRIAELSQDGVQIFADRAEGRTPRAKVVEALQSEIPEGADRSFWAEKHLAIVMAIANEWSPRLWPAPVPFRGERVQGYILGRTA